MHADTRRWLSYRRLSAFIGGLVLLLLALSLTAAAPEKLARQVTIYRDTYGVPHIYGRSDASVVFGLMYAQAEDNFAQLEEGYIRVLGRAAEVNGPGALLGDLSVRLMEGPRRAQEEYARMDSRTRALCQAFAAGLNYYLARHPEVPPRLIRHFEPWFILASQLGSAEIGRQGILIQELLAAFPDLGPVPPRGAPDPGALEEEGSNMWAVGPAKTATGKALLLINPHVGFFGGGQRYEAHLHSKQGLQVSGFAILGTPYIRSGFNERHGWSHTNNYADIVDVYTETFDDPENPLAYRYGKGYRTATEWIEEIPVKAAAGGMEVRRVRLRKTHHGPIVAVRNGHPLALRVVSLERPGQFEQRIAMARARNLREFKAALARATITGSNTIYADRDGNIFYLHGNAIPRRSLKFEWSKPVDGSDPETEWQGFHSLEELPQVTNPRSAFLQNCNSTPYHTTEGDNPATGHPAYMVSEQDNLRAQQSRRILTSREQFSFEEWAKAAMNTSVLRAETLIPAFLAEFDKLKQADASRAARLEETVAELKNWNRVSTVDSVAMTLFMRLTRQGADQGPPDIAALERAKSSLESDFGTWRVPWGDVNRLQRVHSSGTQEPFSDSKPSLPVAGAPGAVGIIPVFNTRRVEGQKRAYGVSGNSYVAVVEFGKKLKARSLLVFGQSADPASKHFLDQAPLYSRGEFKPAWFSKAEVQRNAERSYHPGQ